MLGGDLAGSPRDDGLLEAEQPLGQLGKRRIRSPLVIWPKTLTAADRGPAGYVPVQGSNEMLPYFASQTDIW